MNTARRVAVVLGGLALMLLALLGAAMLGTAALGGALAVWE